jgi:hypothetical protein
MTTLYETDFYSWALQQARALRAAAAARINTPEAVDWENVAEEIESMGREQAAKLRSSLRLALMHLLKWKYQEKLRSASWRITIGRERRNIVDCLEENPGLKGRLKEIFAQAYRHARKDAADETGLPLATFPTTSPFTIEQVRDEDFLPP